MMAAPTAKATPWLLGLTGHAGAGKDSAAAVLASAGYRTCALADALRVEVAEVWGIDPALLIDRARKELPSPTLRAAHGMRAEWLHWCAMQGISLHEPRSPRWVLQQFGSLRRDRDPLHWVKHVLVWISQQSRQGAPGVVITDVRYANEAEALRAQGAKLLRVHRPGLATLPADTATHASEQHTEIAVDGDIHNDGSLADLSAEVWRVVESLSAQQEA